MKNFSDSYKEAGVDVTAGYKAVELMKQHVARTNIPGVVSNIGSFGGLFQPDFTDMKTPIPVSYTHLDVYKRQGYSFEEGMLDELVVSSTEDLLLKISIGVQEVPCALF